MTQGTKKVHATGRYGPRYGVRVRRRVRDIEVLQRKVHQCPNCSALTLKRFSSGIYLCKKCNVKFASAAYYPHPPKEIKKVELLPEEASPESGLFVKEYRSAEQKPSSDSRQTKTVKRQPTDDKRGED